MTRKSLLMSLASIGSLIVITGEEITYAQHVGKVIGDFVCAGQIHFKTIIVSDTQLLVLGFLSALA